jgi:hypothetical protein
MLLIPERSYLTPLWAKEKCLPLHSLKLVEKERLHEVLLKRTLVMRRNISITQLLSQTTEQNLAKVPNNNWPFCRFGKLLLMD